MHAGNYSYFSSILHIYCRKWWKPTQEHLTVYPVSVVWHILLKFERRSHFCLWLPSPIQYSEEEHELNYEEHLNSFQPLRSKWSHVFVHANKTRKVLINAGSYQCRCPKDTCLKATLEQHFGRKHRFGGEMHPQFIQVNSTVLRKYICSSYHKLCFNKANRMKKSVCSVRNETSVASSACTVFVEKLNGKVSALWFEFIFLFLP